MRPLTCFGTLIVVLVCVGFVIWLVWLFIKKDKLGGK